MYVHVWKNLKIGSKQWSNSISALLAPSIVYLISVTMPHPAEAMWLGWSLGAVSLQAEPVNGDGGVAVTILTSMWFDDTRRLGLTIDAAELDGFNNKDTRLLILPVELSYAFLGSPPSFLLDLYGRAAVAVDSLDRWTGEPFVDVGIRGRLAGYDRTLVGRYAPHLAASIAFRSDLRLILRFEFDLGLLLLAAARRKAEEQATEAGLH